MCNRGLHVNTGNDVDTMLITTNIVAGGLHYRGVQREYRRANPLPPTKGPRIEIALEQIEDECAIDGRNGNCFQIFLRTSSIFLRRNDIL